MKQRFILLSMSVLLAFSASILAEVSTTKSNNGNLIMQDIPEVPASIVSSLNRYQNVRSASFQDWTEGGDGIFVSTGLGARWLAAHGYCVLLVSSSPIYQTVAREHFLPGLQ